MFSIVFAIQYDMLGFGDLFRERDKLKDKCETLKRENFNVEQELVELRKKDECANSL